VYNFLDGCTYSIPFSLTRQKNVTHTIDNIVKIIADSFRPQRIILFGSYAYGHPQPDSDIDLLIIMETEKREIDQAQEIRKRLNPLFALDILVYTPRNFFDRLRMGDPFLLEIQTKGKVVYESSRV